MLNEFLNNESPGYVKKNAGEFKLVLFYKVGTLWIMLVFKHVKIWIV